MRRLFAIVALFVLVFAQPIVAQKDDKPGRGGPPDKAAHGKGQSDGNTPGQSQGQGQVQGAAGSRGNQSQTPGNIAIADRDRTAVYAYYRNEFATGNCPPGLAKKNNGCLPPGQAKKAWTIGQPLPGNIVFYPLPATLLAQLTPAPAGYQYVRVVSDVLLMATGTRMIAAALADLAAM
ncbi:MAG: hypothetical protein FJX11_24020 [Alphaproteobacteria bacterium]|nr:hypothetical protein [Alphaproteobacteria bacterium]